jgi:hypothetical protein
LLKASGQGTPGTSFNFFGDNVSLPYQNSQFVDFAGPLSQEAINHFYQKVNNASYDGVIGSLLQYKQQHQPDDWLYYQLIRKTAQAISPKAENYHRYTLYKWFFLVKSGYDAMLCIAGDKLLFYVQSNDNIYNIPFRMKEGKQYVCLNYHDYGNNIDFEKNQFSEVTIDLPQATSIFSYKLTQLPKFSEQDYLEKELRFAYNQNEYRFKIKINPQVKNIFANYPAADYSEYFSAPLSKETYATLIPALKKNLKGLSTKNGVDYLMHFTRYAFGFEPDTENFGQEKRLTPEQTLLYENSDCEDRVALFFYLVKEIYNLPMIVLSYPKHVTIAVRFDKPVGKTIEYNGSRYSICEPTPQRKDLSVGQMLPELRHTAYEVAYVYNPLLK